MSFLSKNGAGILACLLISIVSWYLGGSSLLLARLSLQFSLGMLLHPFLSSYKQLDAGWPLVPRNCSSMLLSCLVLVSISRKSSQLGNLHSPVILSTISIALIVAYLFQRFFALDTKTGYLDWSGFFYLWGLCHCGNSARYTCQGKGSSPSHLRYLFLQCLGCAHLSNSRHLASSIQWRLRPLCRNCRSMILPL